jgi:malonate transporter
MTTSSLQPLIIVVGIVLFGIIVRARKILDETHMIGLEGFLFKIGLPCYLFSVVLSNDLHNIFNAKFIASYLLTFVLTCFIAVFLHRKTSDKRELIMLSLASSYANTALYITPVMFFLFNNAIGGVIANLVQAAFIQPIALMFLTFFANKNSSKMSIVTNVLKTPIIIAPIVAFILNFYGVTNQIHYVFDIVDVLGKSATGIALFSFGLSFSGVKFENSYDRIQTIKIVFVKSIIHPIFAFVVGYFIFNLDRYWLIALVVSGSAPTAYIIYLICSRYDVKTENVKNAIAISCIISIIYLVIIGFVVVR